MTSSGPSPRCGAITDPLRVELMCAGTHPFARWTHQKVTNKQRYATLIDRTQWWGRQMLIYGVHVHVGIEDRDKVLPILRAMLTTLRAPAVAVGVVAVLGRQGHRVRLQPGADVPAAPDGGTALPVRDAGPQLEALRRRHAARPGVIDEFSEIRWDIRPSPRFGTLEMRICDGSPNLTEVLALAALTHCLVEHFSTMLDEGRDLPTLPPWFVQENKWRSARYGMDAIIILNEAGDERLVTDAVRDLVADLEPVAARLGCLTDLEGIGTILRRGASYQRQRAVARRHGGELDAVVASLVAEMRAGRPL